MDASSLLTTNAAAGKPSPIHPPGFRITRSILRTLATQGRRTHLPLGPRSRRQRPPVHGLHTGSTTSTHSSTTPEKSTVETGMSTRGPYSIIAPPPPSPQLRHRKPNPRPTTRTTTDRQGTSGLHHLAKPRGPSEARKTAGPAGGDRSARFLPANGNRMREFGKGSVYKRITLHIREPNKVREHYFLLGPLPCVFFIKPLPCVA